jgi:hypothetical protein
VFGSETNSFKWGECKRWSPMTPKCIPTLGVAYVQEFRIFKALVQKEKIYQIKLSGYHWKGLEV